MKVSIIEATEKVTQFLLNCGLNESDAITLTELVIEQQILGNQFSAIGELGGKHRRLIESSVDAKEEVAVEKAAAMLVKGNGRMAPLITADYLDSVISKAKQQGIYALGIYDASYNDFFDVFCRRVASQDCIAIIVENGGPQGVVPFGGTSDVTGTNPLAYGIPTNGYPIVFDAATAMHAYGRIRQAKERGESLPDNAYVDKDGNITTDPAVAYAVLPFGGFKGWAINLLIDVLSGSLVRAKSGLDMSLENPDRQIGTLVIVIDPNAFGDIEEFKASTTKLVKDIQAVPSVNTDTPVRVPGSRGSKRAEDAFATGMLEIDEVDWTKFLESL
jgi:LDH2 family malate/lactate/ureidoglycolate dehydrogenase